LNPAAFLLAISVYLPLSCFSYRHQLYSSSIQGN
jgi:hypothetical protein